MLKPTDKFYARIASLVQARANCIKSGNSEWEAKHKEEAEAIMREWAPSGSGFDTGTKIDWGLSDGNKLVFTTEFHHMNEYGSYDGWSSHKVIVKPTFNGVDITVTGRDRNDIKEFIAGTFYSLEASIEYAMKRRAEREAMAENMTFERVPAPTFKGEQA